MLFLRSLWKSKLFFFASAAVLLLTTQIWDDPVIIATPGNPCFLSAGEMTLPLIMMLPVSFLLYDNYEIELALINGVKTMRLMLGKFFAAFFAVSLPLLGLTAVVQNAVYYHDKNEEIIPIHVPENFRLYLLLSACVTTLFFASVFLFFRIALRNCYAPVGLALLIHTLFRSRSTDINSLSIGFRNALFDPFLSRYLIGDRLANEGFTVPLTGEVVDPFPHLWTYNRLLFFGIAVVLIAVSCLLLRRENLHESFGD